MKKIAMNRMFYIVWYSKITSFFFILKLCSFLINVTNHLSVRSVPVPVYSS